MKKKKRLNISPNAGNESSIDLILNIKKKKKNDIFSGKGDQYILSVKRNSNLPNSLNRKRHTTNANFRKTSLRGKASARN